MAEHNEPFADEATQDDFNEKAEAAANAVKELLVDNIAAAEYLRPFEALRLASAANEVIETLSACPVWNEHAPRERDEPDADALLWNAWATLTWHLFGPCVDHETLSGYHKRHAVDVAETLGHNHAQALYRFAVLVTKMA